MSKLYDDVSNKHEYAIVLGITVRYEMVLWFYNTTLHKPYSDFKSVCNVF